jgi:hypothetical protein
LFRIESLDSPIILRLRSLLTHVHRRHGGRREKYGKINCKESKRKIKTFIKIAIEINKGKDDCSWWRATLFIALQST